MRFLACLAIMLVFAIPTVAFAQEANGTITIGNSAQQDADIAIRIREIIAELENYGDITVSVSDGVVSLRGTTTSLTEAEALTALANRVEGVVAVRNTVTETTDVAARLNPAVDRFKNRLSQLLTMLPLILIATAVFLVVVLAGFWIARRKQPWNRLAPNDFIAEIYRQVLRIAFFVLGLVVALDILNATALLSTILGAAGIIGLALGFAVRDTVENFIASIMLSIRQPFRPNDAIEINGDEGKVIRLTSRATILLSYDGNHIRIPNSTVFKSRIVNFTRNDERRVKFEIGVASDCDLTAVRELATQTVAGLPFILDDPAPSVWIDRIGDGAIFMTVTGWIDQTQTSAVRAKGESLRQVKNAIEAIGVEVPDTTYRIQMIGEGPGTPSDNAKIKNTAASISHREETVDVAATSDVALERIIDAERAQTSRTDLLDQDGDEE